MTTKPLTKSVTIQGLIPLLLLLLKSLFDVDIDLELVDQMVELLLGVISTAMVIYGRVKASTKIKGIL